MANKWKYHRLDQNDEKEEETVFIDNNRNADLLNNHNQFNTLSSLSSNQRNPFNPINHHSNQDNLDNHQLLDNNNPKYELKLRTNNSPNHRSSQSAFKPNNDSIELVEYTIKPNDSLLSIALSCNCSIEELKRVNKLINDQEFYALRSMKIPVRKYGLLSEVLIHQLNQSNKSISIKEIKESLSNHQLDDLMNGKLPNDQSTYHSNYNHLKATDHNLNHHDQSINSSSSTGNLLLLNEQNSQPLINFNDEEQSATTSTQQKTDQKYQHQSHNKNDAQLSSKSSSTNSLIVNVGLKKTFDFDKTDGDLNKFLVYLDKDLEKMRELTNRQPNPSIIEPLDSNDIYLITNSSKDKTLDCDGASCGLSWKLVFFIAIFICICIPLIYFVIYTEEQNMSHLNHHINHH